VVCGICKVRITLQQGYKYNETFMVPSRHTHFIRIAMYAPDDNNYKWYGCADNALTNDSYYDFDTEFPMKDSADSLPQMAFPWAYWITKIPLYLQLLYLILPL